MSTVGDLWYEDDPGNPGKRRPTAAHGKGRRWEARWRDPEGRRRKRRFTRNQEATCFLACVAEEARAGSYTAPDGGRVKRRAAAPGARRRPVARPRQAAPAPPESDFLTGLMRPWLT